jgi:hypothetical protein
VAKKKVKPPADPVVEIKPESDYDELVKYLIARNGDDLRTDQGMIEGFIHSMNGEHVGDLRDIIEIYIKLDRHACEFWDIKNKKAAN